MNTEFKKRWTAFKIPIGIIAKGTPNLEKNPDDPTKEKFNFFSYENKEINRVNVLANVIDKYQSEGEKKFATLTIDDGTGNMRIRAFSDSISLIKEIELGSTILTIGTLRYFNNELYILPEIIKKLDPRWLLARKLELEKEFEDIYKELNRQIIPPAQPAQSSTSIQLQPTSIQQSPTIAENEVKEEKIIVEPEQEVKQEVKIEKVQNNNEELNEDKESNENNNKGDDENNRKPTVREEIFQLIKESETEQGIDIDKVIMQLNHQPVEKIKSIITELLEAGEIFEPQPGRLRIL